MKGSLISSDSWRKSELLHPCLKYTWRISREVWYHSSPNSMWLITKTTWASRLKLSLRVFPKTQIRHERATKCKGISLISSPTNTNHKLILNCLSSCISKTHLFLKRRIRAVTASIKKVGVKPNLKVYTWLWSQLAWLSLQIEEELWGERSLNPLEERLWRSHSFLWRDKNRRSRGSSRQSITFNQTFKQNSKSKNKRKSAPSLRAEK